MVSEQSQVSLMPGIGMRVVPRTKLLPVDTVSSQQTRSNPKFNFQGFPSLFIEAPTPSNKFVLYFHANAEDLFLCKRMCEFLAIVLDVPSV